MRWRPYQLCKCYQTHSIQYLEDIKFSVILFCLLMYFILFAKLIIDDTDVLNVAKQCNKTCSFAELLFQQSYHCSRRDIVEFVNSNSFPRNIDQIMQNFTFSDISMEQSISRIKRNCKKSQIKTAVKELHQRYSRHAKNIFQTLIFIFLLSVIMYFNCPFQSTRPILRINVILIVFFVLMFYFFLGDVYDLALSDINKYCNPNFKYFSKLYFNKFC